MRYPIDKPIVITNPYGGFYSNHGYHPGEDYGCPIGTPIFAPEDCTVRVAKIDGNGLHAGYGRYVVLESSQACYLMAHLNAFNCKVGQLVKEGDIVAYSGNSGESTGPHIHYEVRRCSYNHFWMKNSDGIPLHIIAPSEYFYYRMHADRFNTIEDVPNWAKEDIKNLMDLDILRGDGQNLDLTLDMVRTLVMLNRILKAKSED